MAKVLGNPDSKKQAVQAMFNLCGKRVAKEIAEELPKIFAKRTISTLLLTLETTVLTTLFDIGAHYLHFWND